MSAFLGHNRLFDPSEKDVELVSYFVEKSSKCVEERFLLKIKDPFYFLVFLSLLRLQVQKNFE
jgi:hypothetical protein